MSVKLNTFGIISTNWWYAVTCSDLIQKSKQKAQIIILTDAGLIGPIEFLLKQFNIYISVFFTTQMEDFIEFLNKGSSVTLIFDHPYRNLEQKCILGLKHKCRIIKMKHGLSHPRGLNRYTKMISNYLRGLKFNVYTKDHIVEAIPNAKASGLLYLNWINENKSFMRSKLKNNRKILLFATSGAGRYCDHIFQANTREALINARNLARSLGMKFGVMVKNRENLSYLEDHISELEIYTGGPMFLSLKSQSEVVLVCHDQSTLVMESKIIGLECYVYRARFKSRLTYAESVTTLNKKQPLVHVNELEIPSVDLCEAAEVQRTVLHSLKN